MNKKERKKYFCWRSNLSNDDIISVDVNTYVVFCDHPQVWKQVWILEARSENGCEKWHFLVWNRVRIRRTSLHEPPPPPPRGVALKGTVKWATEKCNLFCNIAAKRVENRWCAFYHPHQTYFATNQVFNRFERGWSGKTRNIAFQLVCSNVALTSCTFLVLVLPKLIDTQIKCVAAWSLN